MVAGHHNRRNCAKGSQHQESWGPRPTGNGWLRPSLAQCSPCFLTRPLFFLHKQAATVCIGKPCAHISLRHLPSLCLTKQKIPEGLGSLSSTLYTTPLHRSRSQARRRRRQAGCAPCLVCRLRQRRALHFLKPLPHFCLPGPRLKLLLLGLLCSPSSRSRWLLVSASQVSG